MSGHDPLQVKELLARALDLPRDERTAWLDAACDGDAALRAEVQRFLAYETDDRRADLCADGADESPLLPAEIGGYRIIAEIGGGGRRIAYMAEQGEPARTVALQVLDSEQSSPDDLRRFEIASEVLSHLHHPGIARIFETGATETGAGPIRYVVTELARGEPLNRYAELFAPDIRSRLRLMVQIGEAVAHAHERGVAHHDLEPNNILVNEEGRAKVLNFGISRLTDIDAAVPTHGSIDAQARKTLSYMSPERAAGEADEADTRSDVYSLGVLTYELFAGCRPLDLSEAALPEALRRVCEDEAIPLAARRPDLDPEIGIIVAKAMAKEKAQRYATAGAFVADILSHLRSEPIAAHPATTGYVLRKLARRHRAVAAATIAMLVALVVTTVISVVLAVSARHERAIAERQRTEAERRRIEAREAGNFLEQILASAYPQRDGSDVRIVDALDAATETVTENFGHDPLVEAAVRRSLGATYAELERWEPAETELRSALALRQEHLEADHELVGATHHELAELLRDRDRGAEAEEHFRSAIATRRAGGSGQRDALARSLLGLASVLEDQGRRGDSAPLFEETLTILRAGRAGDSIQYAIALNDYANSLRIQGKAGVAAELYAEAVPLLARYKGAEHLEVAMALNNHALALDQLVEPEAAEKLLRRAIAIAEPNVGATSRRVITMRRNLARTLLSLERPGDARDVATAGKLAARTAFGEKHFLHGALAAVLGEALSALGEHGAAEAELRSASDQLAAAIGPAHPLAIHARGLLGRALAQQGKNREAAAAFDEALARALEAGAADSWRAGILRVHYARTLIAVSLEAEALAQLRQARSSLASGPQSSGQHLREALGMMAGLLREGPPSEELGAVIRELKELSPAGH